jgi:hypothetical protein
VGAELYLTKCTHNVAELRKELQWFHEVRWPRGRQQKLLCCMLVHNNSFAIGAMYHLHLVEARLRLSNVPSQRQVRSQPKDKHLVDVNDELLGEIAMYRRHYSCLKDCAQEMMRRICTWQTLLTKARTQGRISKRHHKMHHFYLLQGERVETFVGSSPPATASQGNEKEHRQRQWRTSWESVAAIFSMPCCVKLFWCTKDSKLSSTLTSGSLH